MENTLMCGTGHTALGCPILNLTCFTLQRKNVVHGLLQTIISILLRSRKKIEKHWRLSQFVKHDITHGCSWEWSVSVSVTYKAVSNSFIDLSFYIIVIHLCQKAGFAAPVLSIGLSPLYSWCFCASFCLVIEEISSATLKTSSQFHRIELLHRYDSHWMGETLAKK